MEKYPETNDRKTREQYYKRLVKAVLPSARLWTTGKFEKVRFPHSPFQTQECMVFYFEENAGDPSQGRFRIMGNKRDNAADAWEDAWKVIEKEMLKKLEQ